MLRSWGETPRRELEARAPPKKRGEELEEGKWRAGFVLFFVFFKFFFLVIAFFCFVFGVFLLFLFFAFFGFVFSQRRLCWVAFVGDEKTILRFLFVFLKGWVFLELPGVLTQSQVSKVNIQL